MNGGDSIATLAIGLVLGVGVPVVGVRMLAPSLAESERATTINYRGRRVFYGLGIAWLLWAGAAILGGVVATAFGERSGLGLLTLAGPLALVAFSLGVVDDAYGSPAARGFRGHLTALRRGRLTTGGAKLLGISLASLIVAMVIAEVAPWGAGVQGFAQSSARALVAGAAIALTSNFVNLTDLRPGRALKVYSVLAAFGVASVGALFTGLATDGASSASLAVDLVAVALFAFGPVIAVWSFDLKERGMLGDAGANPMGAVAGLFIVCGLPIWGLAVFAVGMLALNLASERVSFSRVIEGNAFLHRLDMLGRDQYPAPVVQDEHARATDAPQPSASEVESAGDIDVRKGS